MASTSYGLLSGALSNLVIETARVFRPLLEPSRYKAAYGGRGSGKSHFFAELMVEEAIRYPGLRAVCIREVQKSLAESAKKLIEDKIQQLGVGSMFNVLKTEIGTPGGGAILFQGMQDHTAETIKSLEGVDRAWIEEAQTLSDRSLSLLRPTIRKPGSEIWAGWNPRRKTDAIDRFFRGDLPPEKLSLVRANWSDNPWFPTVLEDERQHDLRAYPERYPHIWEGEYATAMEGAYFARHLIEAQQEGRIGHVALDPLMSVRTYHDIGGAGDNADAYVIWVFQFVGREIRVLDYYEAVGQPLGAHVRWLRNWADDRKIDRVLIRLPHDGVNANAVTGKRFEDHWRDASTPEVKFDVQSIPNQGRGAAMLRVEAVRRLFPRIWFNADTTEAGREALGFYHERRDEVRNIGLGPDHDWSSHAADAFGLMAIDQTDRDGEKPRPRDRYADNAGPRRSAWAL